MSFTVEGLKFSYEPGQVVLDGLDFSVDEGRILCLLGPSGCGKTTLFRLLAGILKLSDGVDSEGAIGLGFDQQSSFLFQEPRLLPHLTVMENLQITTPPMPNRDQEMLQLLEAVGLQKFLSYFPDELSGGMQQRLAAVRAFLFPADIMFLDEPFKSLDFKTKIDLIETFKTLYERRRKTVLMITHDAWDAALLADRVIILSERPTRILKSLINPVPWKERHANNPECGAYLTSLLSHLL